MSLFLIKPHSCISATRSLIVATAPLNISNLLKKMEGSLAEQLYSESLRFSKLKLEQDSTQITINRHDEGDLQDEDGSLWGDSDEEKFEKSSDLDREWQRRHDQFHTMGYRDGIIAGKEASAQEGFNAGFKQSFPSGYNWGHVRGVTSALACLPDELKEMLIKTQENRAKFQDLHESVHSLSTTDALRLFHDDILTNKAVEPSEHAETSSSISGLQRHRADCSRLENLSRELQSLLLETPAIQVHLAVHK
ncbi:hypothetical protein LWI29_000699 [Acer saccharum]|uniref:Essential protein Yae1 N-terminal domain-containing protein n=1 Tax=Acer saccharum TaxID=4024 RepID=A0AA39RHJ9_ACESA|nr:hypothetical protein LWI29_000699 [Acer saccharum]